MFRKIFPVIALATCGLLSPFAISQADPLPASSYKPEQSWKTYDLLLANAEQASESDAVGEVVSEEIDDGSAPHPMVFGAHLGTLGVGMHAKYNFAPRLSAGIAVDYMSLGADADYDDLDSGGASIRNSSLTALGSYHVGGGGFHLDAGLQIGAPVIKANARGTYTDTSGTTTIDMDGSAEASRAVGPYFGIGYVKTANETGLSFYGDFGLALMGSMDVNVDTTTDCSLLADLASDCVQDVEDFKNELENLGLPFTYPVIRLGLSYRF